MRVQHGACDTVPIPGRPGSARRHPVSVRSAVATVVASFLLAVPPLAAQDPDAAPDSVDFELSPIEVLVSIRSRVSPSVGSGMPARISTVEGTEARSWKPRLLADAMATLAGVSFYDDLGSPYKLNLSARGFTTGPTVGLPPGISVFVDGIRQNEPSAQEVNFDVLPMAHVERIEFLRGNASLLGPNSQGGAVNLITRQGREASRGEVEVSAGSFGAFEAGANASGQAFGNWGYYLGGGYDEEAGWRGATAGERYHALANLSRVADESGVRLQALFSDSRAETAGSLPESILATDPRVNFTAGDFEAIELQQVSASGYRPLLGGRGSLTTYLRRTHGERFNVNQPPEEDVRSFAENLTLGGTGDWDRSFRVGSPTVSFRAGYDLAASWTRFRIFEEERSGPERELTTDVESPRLDFAGYGMADLTAGPATLSAGARLDYIRIPFEDILDPAADTVNTFVRLSPRAGASIGLGGGVRAFGSVGLSFRAPAILELACSDPEDACPLPFALGDDPPLDPVTATSYELGAEWEAPGVGLSASAYRTDVEDEIFFVPSEESIVEGYFRNLGSTRRAGVELEARTSPAPGTTLTASYAYTEATFQDTEEIFSARGDDDAGDSPLAGENEAVPGDRLPLVPAHQFRLGASYTHASGVGVGLDGLHVGEQWFRGDEANEIEPLEGYVLANARLDIPLGAWGIGVIVRNLLDSDSSVFGTFNLNQGTETLERFLTPVNARSVRVLLRRSFGTP